MLVVKNLPANTEDMRRRVDSLVRKFPWRRAWQPPQYSCLVNPMDRGAWQATVGWVPEQDKTEAT